MFSVVSVSLSLSLLGCRWVVLVLIVCELVSLGGAFTWLQKAVEHSLLDLDSLPPVLGISWGLTTCGKLSGQLYLDKIAKKPPGKCVYVDGQWYTPSEVESLGGKKARKWRQSLFHMGKPLVDYDLTYVEQSGVGDTLPRNNDVDTPPCSVQLPSVHQGLPSVSPCSHSGPPSQQGLATVESSQESGLATAAILPPQCLLVMAALVKMQGFYLMLFSHL